MTWGWLSELIVGIAKLLKVIFGMGKPAETEVHDEESPLPVSSDDDLLADLGLPNPGADGQDGSGDTETGTAGDDSPERDG